ncbi:hypothetical protein LINPERPRIM_LOCUS31779 [Linum perenne]
MWEIVEPTS